MTKNGIRFEIIQKRDAIGPEEARRASDLIADRIRSLPEYKDAKDVFLYSSFRSEVYTRDLIADTIKDKGRVYLPKVISRTKMIFVKIDSTDEIKKGFRGIFEPVSSTETDVIPSLIVVPMVAFDKNGTRLGYGGGYYDRTLPLYKGKCLLAGAAFSAQFHEDIPCDETDIRMDAIITENEVIRIK
ncbi:MAG: 5-formyltetrahydrofolate cyclo-ligase [Lachnospiraceae bacterium]|nr:5-formyltetrahydrofolate cyclo-ligase [Lachnospiraceae bacterium]